jgi:hypothetical protein
MRRSPSARGIAAGVALERRLYAAVITWRATSKAKGLIIEYRFAYGRYERFDDFASEQKSTPSSQDRRIDEKMQLNGVSLVFS